jgi:acyl-coenzyme A thioesterase PaaI-like protein
LSWSILFCSERLIFSGCIALSFIAEIFMTPLAKLYSVLSHMPAGRWLFSRIVGLRVPYFASISPLILEMRSGRVVAQLKQKRRLQNHIGTVHAIAVCNLCELAMGMAVEATIPGQLRWLPKGISANYLGKASGILTATCEIDPASFVEGELDVAVDVHNAAGDLVVTALIPLHVTKKKA